MLVETVGQNLRGPGGALVGRVQVDGSGFGGALFR